MCGGGGGGSKDAERAEQRRQERVQASINQINSVFNDPAQQEIFGRHQQAVFDLNNKDLQRQYQDANRALKFSLAGSGLAGGSAAIDQNAELARLLEEGVLKARQRGMQSASQLRQGDEAARLALIGQAQAGLSGTDAAQRALAQRQLTAEQAGAQGQIASIGDIFGSLTESIGARQRGLGQQAANQGNPFGNQGGVTLQQGGGRGAGRIT